LNLNDDYYLQFDQNWNPSLGFPNYKIKKSFLFGGMKKSLNIPLSMPNRVIIEPNLPRQGYSHLTWNTLNAYYLQKCMSYQQYSDFLYECKKICFKVYSSNREESKMLTDTPFQKASNGVWMFCIITIVFLLISETDE
jgi:hypothetical protein